MSTLASLVQSVGGDKIEVHSLVPVGASVETYEPAPGDLVVLSRARLLVENGAGLETWLSKLLRSGGRTDARILVLSDAVPGLGATSAARNPHLWLDPIYAIAYVAAIAAALRSVDPVNARYYEAQSHREIGRLRALDAWTRAQIETIPKPARAMICFHDAWYYFDRRYGIRDIGAVEPAPGQEPSAGYFAQLVRLAQQNGVRAVFTEPQFSPKLARQLAASAKIATVSDLYDDTVGVSPAPVDYEDMMRRDVTTIVRALRS